MQGLRGRVDLVVVLRAGKPDKLDDVLAKPGSIEGILDGQSRSIPLPRIPHAAAAARLLRAPRRSLHGPCTAGQRPFAENAALRNSCVKPRESELPDFVNGLLGITSIVATAVFGKRLRTHASEVSGEYNGGHKHAEADRNPFQNHIGAFG